MSTNIKLPKDWKWLKLKDICEVVTGTTPPKSDMSNYGSDIPFFKPPHLWDRQIIDTEEKLSLKGAEKARIVPPNTVLVTCIGNLGRTGFVKKKAAFNQQINAILENEKIDGKYVFYQAQSPLFKQQLEKLATGTTVSIVNKGNFETIEIPLPPLAIQQAIVSKIEELFSELDNGIANLKTAQQQLKTYRQSVLKWAFEGKLTNKKVKEGELPKGWETKTLCEVFKVSSGKGIKINELKGGEYAVYGGNGLNGYHSEYFIEEPVLIIGRVGVKCGVTHITKPKSWVSDNALIVKPIITDFDIKYFKLRLEFENLNKLSVSTAQPVISGNSIYSVVIMLPKLDEQNLIVQEIEIRLSVADKMEESINQSLQQAEALRQSILKMAFEGKLV